MTQVILHGILAKEFGKSFSLAIKRPKEVFDAISCARGNFRNRIVELSNQGVHFALLINGEKINTIEDMSIASDSYKIDIVPAICGQGPLVMVAVGAAFAVGGAAIGTASLIGGLLFSLGLSVAMMGIQMMLAPKPEMERPESTVSAAQNSFLLSSKSNTAQQGIPVPIGYGRLRVGSVVVQASIKSYPKGYEKDNSLRSEGQSINNDII